MDFDFSTLLYILFAVVYFVLSRGKKKEKKQSRPSTTASEKQAQPRQESTRRPTFEELLEEFTGVKPVLEQEEQQPTLAPIKVETPKQPKRQERPLASTYDNRSHRSMDTSFGRFEAFEDVKAKESLLDDLRNPDTARKAFIYSEIFKRKY